MLIHSTAQNTEKTYELNNSSLTTHHVIILTQLKSNYPSLQKY